MRLIRHLFHAVVLAVAAVVLLASPAAAHTGFERSDPADGAILSGSLDRVTLVFTGPAEPAGEGFLVLDGAGAVRTPAEASSSDGVTWVLRFDPALEPGAIGVRWTVKAPDAHPIEGSFSFTLEAPVAAPVDSGAIAGEAVDRALTDAEGTATNSSVAATGSSQLDDFLATDAGVTDTARRVGAAARVLTVVGTLLGVGALVFAAGVLRGHHLDVVHVLHWVRRAGVVVVVGAAVELCAQIVVEGGELAALWSPSVVGSVVFSSFGLATGLRIGGGMALTSAPLDITHAVHAPDPVVAIRELVGVGAGPATDISLGSGEPARPRRARPATGPTPLVHEGDAAWMPTGDAAAAITGSVLLLGAHLFDGHTVTKGSRFWTALADIVHVAGGAVWAGGVFMLVAVLWRRHRQDRELRALQLAMRFSVVATVALIAVGLAGLALAVIVLDSPSELWSTEWGLTLLAKTAFVGVAAAAGGYNHKVLIPAMGNRPQDPGLAHRFRMVVTAEAMALVAVLVATALLMGAAS